MTRKALCWLVVLGALIPAAWAQTDLDLSAFEQSLGDRVVAEIFFDSEQLMALVGAAGEENPELNAVLASVESVRARICALEPGEAEAVLASLADTAGQLLETGWMVLVDMQRSGERIKVFLRMEQNHILGFVALFVDGDAGGFAHVAGDLDMQQVMTMAKNSEALRNFVSALKQQTSD